MNEKQKGLVIDWLQEIIDNPEEWKEFYSDSEVKLLAEYAKELISNMVRGVYGRTNKQT